MMKSYPSFMPLAAILLAGFAFSPLRAAEESSSAQQLIKLMNFSTMAKEQAMTVFTPVLERFRAQGLPDEGIQEIKAAAERFFQKTFDDPAIAEEMAKVYQKHFTEAELKELLAFYATPLGKKTLTALPQVMADSNKVGADFAAKNQGDFQKEVGKIISKYQEQQKTAEPEE